MPSAASCWLWIGGSADGVVQWPPRGRRHAAAVDDVAVRPVGVDPGVSITDYATVDANGENALRDIAIGSAIDLICSLTSEMPVDVYRGYGSDRQRVNMPANLKDPGADGHGLQDWLYTLLQSWLYRGNAYGHIVSMSAAGDARQVALLHPIRWWRPPTVTAGSRGWSTASAWTSRPNECSSTAG